MWRRRVPALGAAIMLAAAIGCSGPRDHDRDHEQGPADKIDVLESVDEWEERFAEALQSRDVQQQIEVNRDYLDQVEPAQAAQMAEVTGSDSYELTRRRFKLAELLNKAGQYEASVAQIDRLLENPDNPFPPQRLGFHRVLSDLGQPWENGVIVPDDLRPTLREELQKVEARYTDEGWSGKLNYKLAILDHMEGDHQSVVARVLPRAEAIEAEYDADHEPRRYVNGTVLFLAWNGLRFQGRVQEAEKMRTKIAAFDRAYGTDYMNGNSNEEVQVPYTDEGWTEIDCN